MTEIIKELVSLWAWHCDRISGALPTASIPIAGRNRWASHLQTTCDIGFLCKKKDQNTLLVFFERKEMHPCRLGGPDPTIRSWSGRGKSPSSWHGHDSYTRRDYKTDAPQTCTLHCEVLFWDCRMHLFWMTRTSEKEDERADL